MFEKLSLLWKGDSPLKEEYREFVEMLKMARQLYHKIIEILRSGENISDLENFVYQSDIKINKLERKIRKALVAHLSINPGQATTGCLVLMSVTKDAERLGDFCKNLYEASAQWCRSCTEMYFGDKIVEYEDYVSEVFDSTINAFETEDDVLASEIIQDEVKWNRRFDNLIGEVAESDLSSREAVCTVLMIRSLKRLQAHLSNIASSVVLPVHRIDHRPKHLRD